MPEQPRHLANIYEDIVNLQGAGAYLAASRTACSFSDLGGIEPRTSMGRRAPVQRMGAVAVLAALPYRY